MDSLHFIGIGGCGMTPLAQYAKALGLEVTGSDVSCSQNTDSLLKSGITVYNSHQQSNVVGAPTVVYSSAIKENNPELLHAKSLGLQTLHRSDLLATFCKSKKLIAIAGSHGKTTTSALVTHILRTLHLSPNAIIGGNFADSNNGHQHGSSNYLVAEADESDGSFIHYFPHISVITNIDPDHIDHYKTFERLKQTFYSYALNTHKEGCLITCHDFPNTQELLKRVPRKVLTFGYHKDASLRCMQSQKHNLGTLFDFTYKQKLYSAFIPIIGKHNILNTLAALSVCVSLNLDIEKAIQACATFPGLLRRSNILLHTADKLVIDDYAHNPGKIAAFCQSLKQQWPHHHLTIIFEPHRYTRTKNLYHNFCKSFLDIDRLILLPVYSAGEAPLEDLCMNQFAQDISLHSKVDTSHCENFTDVCSIIRKETQQQKSIFATVGAGGVSALSEDLKRLLKERFIGRSF